MENLELAKEIVKQLGGKDNIIHVTNCMTRLRATVKDPSQVSVANLKGTDNVLGVVEEGDYYQIVLGPGKAKKVTDAVIESFGISRASTNWQENKEYIKSTQKQGGFRRALQTIANIFIPLIPAIIAAGLFNGFGSLFGQLIADGVMPESWNLLPLTFTLLGGAFLGYFAIYTGIRAAEEFGATPALGGMIGGASIGANVVEISRILGLYNEEIPLESILTTGKGGIIGVIVGVWILAYVERWIRKRVPDVLDLVVTPFVSLLITGTIFVLIIMPLAGFFSDFLVSILSVTINSSNTFVQIISGYLLAALFLPMVLLGLHHGLIPIYTVQLQEMGGVSLFPVLAMAGAGQVGAAIAIYMMAKKQNNQHLIKVITGALPAGFLGVGEPLIYGVTLPMFKPFITAGLGAGFGGAYVMMMGVMANAWGPSGLVAIPLMQGSGMLHFFIGLVISYIAGFIITRLVIKPEDLDRV